MKVTLSAVATDWAKRLANLIERRSAQRQDNVHEALSQKQLAKVFLKIGLRSQAVSDSEVNQLASETLAQFFSTVCDELELTFTEKLNFGDKTVDAFIYGLNTTLFERNMCFFNDRCFVIAGDERDRSMIFSIEFILSLYGCNVDCHIGEANGITISILSFKLPLGNTAYNVKQKHWCGIARVGALFSNFFSILKSIIGRSNSHISLLDIAHDSYSLALLRKAMFSSSFNKWLRSRHGSFSLVPAYLVEALLIVLAEDFDSLKVMQTQVRGATSILKIEDFLKSYASVHVLKTIAPDLVNEHTESWKDSFAFYGMQSLVCAFYAATIVASWPLYEDITPLLAGNVLGDSDSLCDVYAKALNALDSKKRSKYIKNFNEQSSDANWQALYLAILVQPFNWKQDMPHLKSILSRKGNWPKYAKKIEKMPSDIFSKK